MSNLTFDGGMFFVFIFFRVFFGGGGRVCIYNYKIANIRVTLLKTDGRGGAYTVVEYNDEDRAFWQNQETSNYLWGL